MAIHKPQSQARAQSLVKAFPNLAGSDLPGALGAAPTPSLWFAWSPQFVLWGKWRRLRCKGNTSGGWEGEPLGKPSRDQPSQHRVSAHPITPLPSPGVHSSASCGLEHGNASFPHGSVSRGVRDCSTVKVKVWTSWLSPGCSEPGATGRINPVGWISKSLKQENEHTAAMSSGGVLDCGKVAASLEERIWLWF